MKIETNVTREFLDETLYIATHYKMLKTNPTKKVHGMTKELRFLSTMALGIFIIMVLFNFYYKTTFLGILTGAYATLLIITLSLLVIYRNRIKELMKLGKRIIELKDKHIEYTDDIKNVGVSWNEIDKIIINKYSICFLPKNLTGILIAIGSEYKNEVVKTLGELGYKSLVIDNTSSYK